METIDKIPTSKIKRASKLIGTGAKVGVNYLKYYGDKLINNEEDAKGRLDEANATDIYDTLKNLKGSALKVAQMLSMEKSIMPEAYTDKFSLSQFSVPPLSPPLVLKTFHKYFGKSPKEIYDKFNSSSKHAASIGQVHEAEKDGKKLAVKIQYPGVSDSISSDLAMIKPIAIRMFNIKAKDSEKYFQEVESKLLEETDYKREVEQSIEAAENCKNIPNILFPTYYPDMSSDRIITMDWMEGEHLSEFVKNNKDDALANKIGQTLWDYFMFQMHHLNTVNADPHPGNFLVSKKGELIAIDFGCVKQIPKDFYEPYSQLFKQENLDNPEKFKDILMKLDVLKENDSEEEGSFFENMFHQLLSLFMIPFNQETFDFSDEDFFGKIAEMGESYTKKSELRKYNANRGATHFIYVNRTNFGFYNLMHMLKAKDIKIFNYKKYL